MVDTQDAGTLTDVCISEQLPEVELISLVEESLPRYRLRADTITDFTDYKHQDWGVKQPPLIRAQDLQLTHLQIQEVFKYFLICGERVSQMTKVFDDIEAVTRLLEEKEKDLELAARIGQTLLEQNKSLVDKCEQLELDLISYQEQTSQLKHDLIQKETLLQLLTAEEQTDGRNPSPTKETSSSKYVELIQKKLSSMEEENSNLRSEISNLAEQTQQIEQHEQNLTKDCIQQLSDAQIRIRELQAEVDQKGVDLIKCQEECSRVIQQLVSGQQKLKELTIENLDMKETIKTSNEIQQELTSELFELREKYKECKDLLDSTKHEVDQLKLKSSPRVATNRYYSGPCYIPPEGSFAAELESLNSVDRDEQRKSNSKALETAQYVRKLSSRPPSMSSSMSSSSGRLPGVNKKGVNPLLVAPIPGSATRRAVDSPLTTSMISGISTITNTPIKPANATASSSRPSGLFFDEIERHRQNLGRPGIPGSKDLDAALKRLSLRRQNEASEKEYELRERHISQQSTQSTQSTDTVQSSSKLPQLNLEWSGASTPTVRSPSPESELSGYGSASSFGYRMPEKLQIVKPMEGSATLHHWQRLATPHMAGIFEERDGVQIKHEQPLTDMESTTYSLLDVEEEVTPVRPMARTFSTYTVTDARVMHPSMTSFIPYTTPANSVINTSTVTSSSGNSRYGLGVVSRLDSGSTFVSGLNGLSEDLPNFSASIHRSDKPPNEHALSHDSNNVVTKPKMSPIMRPSVFTGNESDPINRASSKLREKNLISGSSVPKPVNMVGRPASSFEGYGLSSLTHTMFTTPTKMGSLSSVSVPKMSTPKSSSSHARTQPAAISDAGSSFGILSSFYNYMKPGPATTTTNSGLSTIVSDQMFGSGDSRATRSAFGRWQSPW